MKVIGRTEAGARLVEISTEEMIALGESAKTLVHICSNMIPFAPGEQPAMEPMVRKESGRTRGSAAPTKKTSNRHKTCEKTQSAIIGINGTRLCLYCKKPLPANAHPRMKTHKGECNTMFCREYARNRWREKQDIKNILPPANPADPTLTDEQRIKLKANREDVLRTINKRIDERQG